MGKSFIRVFGMQRSGNHAIIEWLRQNSGHERSLFLNNCAPGSAMNGATQIEFGVQRIPRKKILEMLESESNTISSIFVSYENKNIDNALSNPQFTKLPSPMQFDTCRNVIIHRSWTNWLASILQHYRNQNETENSTRNPVLRVAALLETYKRILSAASREGIVSVSYDSWLTDEEYRVKKLDELGLLKTGAGIHEHDIPARRFFAGSSFDSETAPIDRSALLTRSSLMEGDEEFQILMRLATCDREFTDLIRFHYPGDLSNSEQIR